MTDWKTIKRVELLSKKVLEGFLTTASNDAVDLPRDSDALGAHARTDARTQPSAQRASRIR